MMFGNLLFADVLSDVFTGSGLQLAFKGASSLLVKGVLLLGPWAVSTSAGGV